ncbi:hypothetical protein F5876DRAFT_68394 [Lentinula aff. lateritia]|uniref:Uncharacterized protein n=1 Tax=Lentinula aff. lateritia TaxID=2804960 RepID=A0ACC1TQT1_9AGAR|nr:hypothetical protein F5876DRAFT_68394 [Lentinula aff. lateritia]
MTPQKRKLLGMSHTESMPPPPKFIRFPLSNVIINKDNKAVRFRSANLIRMVPTPSDPVEMAHIHDNQHLHEIIMGQQTELETAQREVESLHQELSLLKASST